MALDSPPQHDAAAKPPRGRRLSEDVARRLSLGGTLASWTLFFGSWPMMAASEKVGVGVMLTGMVGTFLAPNLGHWYQGKVVTIGTGIRVIGGLGVLVGFGLGILCGGECNDPPPIAPFLLGGGILYIGGTIYDIVDAPRRAAKHNRRIEALGLVPVVTNGAAGLGFGGRF